MCVGDFGAGPLHRLLHYVYTVLGNLVDLSTTRMLNADDAIFDRAVEGEPRDKYHHQGGVFKRLGTYDLPDDIKEVMGAPSLLPVLPSTPHIPSSPYLPSVWQILGGMGAIPHFQMCGTWGAGARGVANGSRSKGAAGEVTPEQAANSPPVNSNCGPTCTTQSGKHMQFNVFIKRWQQEAGHVCTDKCTHTVHARKPGYLFEMVLGDEIEDLGSRVVSCRECDGEDDDEDELTEEDFDGDQDADLLCYGWFAPRPGNKALTGECGDEVPNPATILLDLLVVHLLPTAFYIFRPHIASQCSRTV